MAFRITEAQGRMFFGPEARPAGKQPGKPRIQKPREQLPENLLEKQITDFLAYRGWELTRQHVGTFIALAPCMDFIRAGRPIDSRVIYRNLIRIGAKGMADWRASRPVIRAGFGMHQVFYFETKAHGRRPSSDQRLWLERMAATGTPAAWFDDFQGDWDTSFVPWYRERFGD